MSSEPGMEPLDAARLTPPDQRGFGRQCEHGSLSRSCELCWAHHEIALLQRELRRAIDVLRRLEDSDFGADVWQDIHDANAREARAIIAEWKIEHENN